MKKCNKFLECTNNQKFVHINKVSLYMVCSAYQKQVPFRSGTCRISTRASPFQWVRKFISTKIEYFMQVYCISIHIVLKIIIEFLTKCSLHYRFGVQCRICVLSVSPCILKDARSSNKSVRTLKFQKSINQLNNFQVITF